MASHEDGHPPLPVLYCPRMKWGGARQSTNVVDRRGMPVRGAAIGGGGVVLALVVWLLGGDPGMVQDMLAGGETTQTRPADPAEEPARELVAYVLADTEDTWNAIFQKQGRQYQEPKLNVFSGSVESACGIAGSAVGPFYCPADREVYLDLSFFTELSQKFGAPGDFAAAYVVAHEVGHHVQTLTGVSERVQSSRARLPEAEANRLTVKQELQADCLAGVWAHHAKHQRNRLEAGDVEEGLRAAAAIGDDTLQKRARGRVAPESFTHGTSEQRVRWFQRGLESGDMNRCDTFGAATL